MPSYPKDISAVSDDAPFFWHFSTFSDVLRNYLHPIDVHDPEDSIGERVLILLFGICRSLFAAIFLLLPFVVVRRQWRALPAKGVSAVYFAALGLGFMLFEITMIQRLIRFLGYPTYSLTVTLAALLVVDRYRRPREPTVHARAPGPSCPSCSSRSRRSPLFYEFGLDAVTDDLQHNGLAVRVIVSVAVLWPRSACASGCSCRSAWPRSRG